jgi:hypothetical protein
VVETIRLESGHTLTGIGGSNPPLSASFCVVFWKKLTGHVISAICPGPAKQLSWPQ